jgi:hypothetical protein
MTNTKYVCDMCDKTITGPDRVLIVKADSLTFCNDACAERWLNAEIKKEDELVAIKKGKLGAKTSGWGGARTPGPGKSLGPKPLPEDQKRQPVSTRLAPDVIDNNGEVEGSKELAQAIAEVFELGGWGRAVDEAWPKWGLSY